MIRCLSFICCLFFSIMASAQLTVEIRQLDGAKGNMFMAVYNSADSFLDESQALRTEKVPIQTSDFSFTFSDLPAGDYAIAVFQDVNGNDQLDKGMFGIPKEPYGFSNDARGSFGPPSYEQARFSYSGQKQSIRIQLR